MIKKNMTRTILAGILAAGMTSCAPPPELMESSQSSISSDASLENYIEVSFDEIYSRTYNGYSVMYQAYPQDFKIQQYDDNYPNMTLLFADDSSTRFLLAYCEDFCIHPDAVGISETLLEMAAEKSLPVRVYGNLDGKNIKMMALSFLTSPGQWESFKIDSLNPVYYQTGPEDGGE